ncbi:MAG: hypothetical protein GWP04_12365 [Gammaproteobacteria bacterium]|nr:hypothetical protein [Gammaproteobacteria bacterium]
MIAGRINEIPDADAVVAALAPNLAGDGNQATANLNAREVQVRDQDGNLIGSVPFTDIDPRFEYTASLESTILWSSPDGTTWNESETTLLPGGLLAPVSLLAYDTRFVLGTVGMGADTRTAGYWESTDGVAWVEGTEAEASIVVNSSVWGERIVAATGRRNVVVFDSAWRQSILTVPFDDIEPKDRGNIGTVTAGPVGLVVTSYDGSTESVPTKFVWFTPDGQSWVRYGLNGTFGATGNVAVAAGTDRVLLILGPDQPGGANPISSFQTWIGTPSPVPPIGSTVTTTPAASTTPTAPGQEASDQLPPLPAGTLEMGIQYRYRFGIHCGMRYIEGADGRNWETERPPYDGVGRFPDALRAHLENPNESISPVVVGSIELISADLLEFRAGDVVVRYGPTTSEIPGCA